MEPVDVIPVSAFERFFSQGKLAEHERDYLLAHYAAPNRTATTPQIGKAMGTSMGRVNITCGRLGRRIANEVGTDLGARIPSCVLVEFDKMGGPHWYSIMRDTVASAMERLGWAEEAIGQFAHRYPAMVHSSLPDSGYLEGRAREANIVARARNPNAREECISHYGPVCTVCGFDFALAYGARGEGFIEVHHAKPIAARTGTYAIDPIADLKPVCCNCHRMLHRGDTTISIDDLRSRMRRQQRSGKR